MPPALTMALIVTLTVLLAIASATAGALWWRLRSTPTPQADPLADRLVDRLKTLDAIVARLQERPPAPAGRDPTPAGAGRPAPRRRPHRAEAVPSGPTLIAVPDLAAPAGDAAPTVELGRRFGAIWELADAGASAESIARATAQPIGQVELILGLRRQLAAGGRP